MKDAAALRCVLPVSLQSSRSYARATLLVVFGQRRKGQKVGNKREERKVARGGAHLGRQAKRSQRHGKFVSLFFLQLSPTPHYLPTRWAPPAASQLRGNWWRRAQRSTMAASPRLRRSFAKLRTVRRVVYALCVFLGTKKTGKTPNQTHMLTCCLLFHPFSPPLTTGGGARAEPVSSAVPPKELARVIANDQVRDPYVYTLVQSVPCSRRRC